MARSVLLLKIALFGLGVPMLFLSAVHAYLAIPGPLPITYLLGLVLIGAGLAIHNPEWLLTYAGLAVTAGLMFWMFSWFVEDSNGSLSVASFVIALVFGGLYFWWRFNSRTWFP